MKLSDDPYDGYRDPRLKGISDQALLTYSYALWNSPQRPFGNGRLHGAIEDEFTLVGLELIRRDV